MARGNEREPVHPQVDWSTRSDATTRATVVVICPEETCGLKRRARAASIAMLIRRGEFTGRCLAHRELRGPRLGDYQAAPGVDYSKTRMLLARGGREHMSHVLNVCIDCGAERWTIPSVIQFSLRAGSFTGRCRRCQTQHMVNETTDARRLDSSGYVLISSKRALSPTLHAAFDMIAADKGRATKSGIYEHAIIMAARLGRPLRRNETVHHRNGKRADNRPSNLRLYTRGEHHPGYGDFYQEWQEALSEIARLRQQLTQLSEPP